MSPDTFVERQVKINKQFDNHVNPVIVPNDFKYGYGRCRTTLILYSAKPITDS